MHFVSYKRFICSARTQRKYQDFIELYGKAFKSVERILKLNFIKKMDLPVYITNTTWGG